jgi:hypothetical protein
MPEMREQAEGLDGGTYTRWAFIDHETPESILYDLTKKEQRLSGVNMLLGCLKPRERYILRRRMLNSGGSKMALNGDSLKTIGQDLGVSRERVRQIQVEAIERLRRMMKGMTEDDLYDAVKLRERVKELEGSLDEMVESYDVLMETVLPRQGMARGVVSGAFGSSPTKAKLLLRHRLRDSDELEYTPTTLPTAKVRNDTPKPASRNGAPQGTT